MSGWRLREGEIVDDKVNDDELWSLFSYVFSENCKKTNTYKFGLIKSICDQIYDLYDDGKGFFLSYEKIFLKFTENYWNLVNKYKLRQMKNNGKSEYSQIERILNSAVESYNIPEEVVFSSLHEDERKSIINKVFGACKKYVIGALYNDFEGKLYAFDLKGTGIFLSSHAYGFISKYKMEIERLNYYAWARFLEKVNSDDVLVRVLEKLDMATPQRRDLSIYREILYKEFEENTCFYCGKKLSSRIHVDHFIPWMFVKNDNLWNFVLSCPECNIKKSGNLFGGDYLTKIDARNNRIINEFSLCSNPLFVENEFTGYYNGLLDRIWNYAKMSGIRVCS